jgi:thymidylate synthase
METEQQIIDYWNSKKQEPFYKKTKDGDRLMKWKGCRELSIAVRNAINAAIKNTSLESLKSAIDNYALVVWGREYFWSYCWGLYDFLTRRVDKVKDNFSWYRFIPDNFDDSTYLCRDILKQQTTQREFELDREKRRLQSGKTIDIAQNAVKQIPAEENRRPLIQSQINTILKDAKTVPVNKPYIPLPEAERQRRLENIKKQLLIER